MPERVDGGLKFVGYNDPPQQQIMPLRPQQAPRQASVLGRSEILAPKVSRMDSVDGASEEFVDAES